MQAVLAGWVAGYTVSVVFTIAGTLWLARRRRIKATDEALAPERSSRLSIAVLLSIGGFLAWTLAGIVLGAAYQATAESATAAVGSPAVAFTGAVVGVAIAAGAAVCVFGRRVAWEVVVVVAAAAGAFGWLLPGLAER